MARRGIETFHYRIAGSLHDGTTVPPRLRTYIAVPKGTFTMKRFVTLIAAAAIAATTVGSTAALAQQYAPYPPPYHHDNGPGPDYYHHWHHGDRFYGPHRYIDWRHDGLQQPPYGYRWVQDGPQFLLLNLSNGFIANVVIR
jgi:Ni/Co efflux regulator RcnB